MLLAQRLAISILAFTSVMVTEQETISVSLMKWALGGMAGLVLILIAWLKSALKENKELSEAWIADLRERNKAVSRQPTPEAFPRPKFDRGADHTERKEG